MRKNFDKYYLAYVTRAIIPNVIDTTFMTIISVVQVLPTLEQTSVLEKLPNLLNSF